LAAFHPGTGTGVAAIVNTQELGALDAAGFRFGRHPAPLVFPLWAAGLALTWPWLGRPAREGLGLQTVVLAPA
jgi:hypothetical protein